MGIWARSCVSPRDSPKCGCKKSLWKRHDRLRRTGHRAQGRGALPARPPMTPPLPLEQRPCRRRDTFNCNCQGQEDTVQRPQDTPLTGLITRHRPPCLLREDAPRPSPPCPVSQARTQLGLCRGRRPDQPSSSCPGSDLRQEMVPDCAPAVPGGTMREETPPQVDGEQGQHHRGAMGNGLTGLRSRHACRGPRPPVPSLLSPPLFSLQDLPQESLGSPPGCCSFSPDPTGKGLSLSYPQNNSRIHF